MNKTGKLTLKALVAISYGAMIVVNALANVLPLNGISTGAVSDAYPNLFAPAGITFGIWGVIYLALGCYVIYQFIRPKSDTVIQSSSDMATAGKSLHPANPSQTGLSMDQPIDQISSQSPSVVRGQAPDTSANQSVQQASDLIRQQQFERESNWIRFWCVVSSLANSVWIFAWHYQALFLSVLLMTVLLFSLISINLITSRQNRQNPSRAKMSLGERLFVRLPFSLYFGWITVATIANVTTFMVNMQWNRLGLSETLWTIVLLLIGTVIGSAVILINRDYTYGLVMIWAYIGILIKHVSDSGHARQYLLVIITTMICLVLFLLVEAKALYWSGKRDARLEAAQKQASEA